MTHADWQRRGFRTIPVIPPRAPLANPLNKALAHERGKAPGLKGAGGRWYGFGGWRAEKAPDAAVMDGWGASVGLPTDGLLAVDLDTMDESLALALEAVTLRVAGDARLRIGRAPKRLLLYASAAPTAKHMIVFRRPGMAEGDKPERIEVMADGQQVLVAGEHPGTGRPYEWPRGVPDRAGLTVVDADGLEALMAAWRGVLEAHGCEVVSAGSAAAIGDRHLVSQSDLVAPSVELLEAAVRAMPNDGAGYDDWIPGLCAIKAAAFGLLDDGGRELARDWTGRWSGAGDGAPIDFDTKWDQLRGPFVIGWPWIEARARGLVPAVAAADFAGVEVAALAKTLLGDDLTEGEAGTLQEMAFRDWRWVESVERFGSVKDGSVLTAKQFSVRLNWWGPPMSSAKSAAALFLADKRMKAVTGLTYKPGGGFEVTEDGIGLCLNTWRPGSWVKREGVTEDQIRPWRDHMERMFPRPEVRRAMILWMAHLVQRPGVKINWAPVLGSKQGVGKDWMLLPVKWALGEANVATIAMKDVEGAFNDWCAGACLAVLNEAHSSTRVLTSETLKPHIAAPPHVLWINSKHEKQRKQPNRHCMLLMTNRRDAVAIEAGDRRYFVVWIEKDMGLTAEWWREAYEWMEGGGKGLVASWLSDVSLEGFVAGGAAPWTEEKGEMERDTMSDVAAAAADGIESGEWPDLVNPGDLAARLNAMAGPKGRGFSGRGLALALKNQGARVVQSSRMIRLAAPCFTGAVQVRLMALRNFAEYEAMPPVALGRAFSAAWAKFDGKDFADVKPALTAVTHTDLL